MITVEEKKLAAFDFRESGVILAWGKGFSPLPGSTRRKSFTEGKRLLGEKRGEGEITFSLQGAGLSLEGKKGRERAEHGARSLQKGGEKGGGKQVGERKREEDSLYKGKGGEELHPRAGATKGEGSPPGERRKKRV